MRAKFERTEKLHLTLAFLGSVAAQRVETLTAALALAAESLPAMTLRFDCTGAFPDERHARIVWVGSKRADVAYESLAAAVREAARPFAALDEKRAVAHVTVARLRDPQSVTLPRFAAVTMHVEKIALFESLPDKDTTRYEVVASFPLTSQESTPAGSR